MFVAAVAGEFTVRSDMAGLALRLSLVAVIDRKSVLSKLGRVPAAGFVTVFAGQAKISEVNFRFSVTCLAIGGRSLVILVNMTGQAIDLKMAPIQWEHSLVIERPHPVHPVMALEAAASQLSFVLKHKRLVIECVASKAGLL